MSKIVLVCVRAGTELSFSARDIRLLSARLNPDNITPRPPRILKNAGLLMGIINPLDSVAVRDNSVCMGVLIEDGSDWWKPGAEVPDGSYALFRSNETSVELVSDIVASRTIWYAQTDELFIASTSQRAIVFFLQGFQLNKAVYSWMLSSGTLGPGLSWDERIQALPGNARLILDRSSWRISVASEPVQFSPQRDLSDKEHETQLREAIENTFRRLNLDLNKWVLPLSGGVDSRAILLMLKGRPGLRTVTWGLGSAIHDKSSDAYVAKLLASAFGIENRYYETDMSNEPAERILNRFIVAGEGRIDHISGYMDGFRIWKQLFDDQHNGIIRGDEAFGCRAVRNDHDVHRNAGLVVLSDFTNTQSLIDILGDCKQQRSDLFEQGEEESRVMWRVRLNAEFEIPVIFAALSDLKLPYVEIINPLLSRRIVKCVCRLPDHLRIEKRLFRKIVNSISPTIKFAKSRAIATRIAILMSQPVVDVIRTRLEHPHTKKVLPDILVDYGLATLKSGTDGIKRTRKKPLLNFAGKVKRRMFQNKSSQTLHPNILGFRLYIISQMTELLSKDAKALSKS